MEITKLSANALRIKGKKSTFLIDVLDTKKTEANAYLFLTENGLKASYTREGLLISGPGDYEVSGAKISAARIGEDVYYEMQIDGIRILVAKAKSITAGKDKIEEQQVILLYADTVLDQSAITNLVPAIVVCYGEKAEEVSALLGKGLGKTDEEDASASKDADIKPVDKFSITADKLPLELEVVLLQ